ncbi:MAG: glucose-6-phosphate isomerase [Bacillota bacterium]|nr:glucose-6-phosphate isomerase [Bacillota bacterium]
MTLTLDYSKALEKVEDLAYIKHLALASKEILEEKSGAGADFLGWTKLPEDYDQEEFSRIKEAAKKIKGQSQALLVIGIGGSYLGAKAAISALTNNFHNEMSGSDDLKIYFAGQNLSQSYLIDLYNLLKDQDFSINVISKSGTTTEPAIAFRIFKELLEEKYGDQAKDRIYATTDKEKGALRDLAVKEGYQTFVVPDDIGGRYSVLTAVGLLPMACAGIDIDQMMEGAKAAALKYSNPKFEENDALLYAAIRNALNRQGKDIELMVSYTPELFYFSQWWIQLFGESEGKDGKGLFPAAGSFTTDLHSMGQMIQDGRRNLFETVVLVSKADKDLTIKEDQDNLDGLNYLAGKTLSEINKKAFEGTYQAHVDGRVPNLLVEIERLDAYNLGYLFYFFQKACGYSAYMLGVNPFNQPGVEKYKANMFKLLGKPGY